MAKVRTKMSTKKRRLSKAFSKPDLVLAKGIRARLQGEASKAKSLGKAEVIKAKAEKMKAKAEKIKEKAQLANAKQGAQKTKYRSIAAGSSAMSAFDNASEATTNLVKGNSISTDQMIESGLKYSTTGREDTDSNLTGIEEFNNFYK